MLRLLTALALIAAATGAGAHALHLSLQTEASGVRGQAFFADGRPARGAAVAVYAAADDRPQARAHSDAEGRFHLPLAAAGDFRVVVDDGRGHRAETALRWEPAPTTTDATELAPVVAQTVSTAVRAELVPLREDLARLQARTRLAEAIGGVGMLIGLFGALAWWRARHRG